MSDTFPGLGPLLVSRTVLDGVGLDLNAVMAELMDPDRPRPPIHVLPDRPALRRVTLKARLGMAGRPRNTMGFA